MQLKLKTLEQLDALLRKEKAGSLQFLKIEEEILHRKYRGIEWDGGDMKKLIETPLKDEKEIKRVEIIILGWELPDAEIDCLSHIIKNTTHPYKITFYDNRPNSYRGCNTSKIWNKLVRESTCPYVLIMDSDAFIKTENALDILIDALDRHPECAVIGAMSGGGSTVMQAHHELGGGEFVAETNSHASGYCFLFKREIFDIIGPFDEDFYVYGQDSDWMNRLNEMGYRVLLHKGVLIQHGYDSQTFSLSNRKANEIGKFSIQFDSTHSMSWVVYKRLLRENKRKQAEFKKKK